MISAKSLERLLLRDRSIVVASLIGLTALAWLYLALLSAGMARGDMSLMGMAPVMAEGAMTMTPQPWAPATFVLMLVMWWIMMVGMMVPSAAPMILLYARVQRHAHKQGQGDGIPQERPPEEQEDDQQQPEDAPQPSALLPGEKPGELDILG